MSCPLKNFALSGFKVVSRDIFLEDNLRCALRSCISFLLVNRYEKRDYHSYTFLFEDILNTWLRQRNLPLCYLLGKGVVKSRAHSPTFPSLHIRQNSFSNPSVTLPTSQFILQPFFRFSYVMSSSLIHLASRPCYFNIDEIGLTGAHH